MEATKNIQTEDRNENGFPPIPFRKKFGFGGDKALWIVMIALAVISLLVVFSSTRSMSYRTTGGNISVYLLTQLKYIFISFVAVYFIHRINYQNYAKYARLLFIFSLCLMALTFFIGVNLNQASRWLHIPVIGLTFQPADFIKITLVMVLARELSKRQATIHKSRLIPVRPLFHYWLPEQAKKQNRHIFYETTVPLLLPVCLACAAIMFSNFSTAALTFFSCLVMLYVGRVRGRELWRLVRMVIVVVAILLLVMSSFNIGRAQTWVNRITSFVKTEQADDISPGSDSFQVEQAKIAIASGGIFGKGPGMSTQRANLPHSYSDFAYAFIVEEYGLFGALVVLALYLWLFFRTVIIFQKCERAFPSLLVLGLGIMIVLQAIFNMLVSVNLFPVTGQPLPLISLGGSSMLFTSIALGMIQGVSRQMHEKTLGTIKEDGIK